MNTRVEGLVCAVLLTEDSKHRFGWDDSGSRQESAVNGPRLRNNIATPIRRVQER